jgi:hypothetical protein
MVSEHTVRHHYDYGYLEHVRQPLGQFEWNHMPDMHNITAGPSACVDEEWLFLLEPSHCKLGIFSRVAIPTYLE